MVTVTEGCLHWYSRDMLLMQHIRSTNLLQSASGVDHFHVIPGSSNGHELIAFFENALADRNSQGMGILLRGDTVIMDNCGFHHGRFI